MRNLLAIAVALMAVNSAIRIFKSSSPHLKDVAIVLLAYYCLPTALVDYLGAISPLFTPLTHEATRTELQSFMLLLCLAAILAIQAGDALGRGLKFGTQISGPSRYLVIGRDSLRIWTLTASSLLLIGVGVTLFGAQAFAAGYNNSSSSSYGELGQALTYFGILCSGITLGHIALSGRATRRPMHRLPTILLISILAAILFIRPKRLEIFAALAIPIVVLSSTTTIELRKSVKVLFAVGIVFTLCVVACFRIGQDLSLESIGFHVLSEGFIAGHAGPGILSGLESGATQFEDGSRIYSAFIALLPSIFFNDKASTAYGLSSNIAGAAPQGAASAVAETYLQGGLVPHLLIWFIFGGLFGFASCSMRGIRHEISRGRLSLRFLMYLMLFTVFLPHLRDGIIPAFKLAFQGVLVWAGVFLLPADGVGYSAFGSTNANSRVRALR